MVRNTRRNQDSLQIIMKEDESPDIRRDWIIFITVPANVDKCCKRLNDMMSKQGWKRYCSPAISCRVPYDSTGIKVNTFEVVMKLIVKLPFCLEARPF